MVDNTNNEILDYFLIDEALKQITKSIPRITSKNQIIRLANEGRIKLSLVYWDYSPDKGNCSIRYLHDVVSVFPNMHNKDQLIYETTFEGKSYKTIEDKLNPVECCIVENELKIFIETCKQKSKTREPQWEKARKIDKEPTYFLSFACEAYWHSKDHEGRKKQKLPVDIAELERWLKHNKKRTNNFDEVTIVDGYVLSIGAQWRIDNMEANSKKISYEDKTIKSSFKTVVFNLTRDE